MAAFERRLASLRSAPGAADLPLASEACLCPATALRQAEKRVNVLSTIAEEPELEAFLRKTVAPLIERGAERVQGLNEPLEPEMRTLSPSDFGWHNMLMSPRGPVFIDFEYFGWDDPVKLACDVFWHPAMAMPPNWGVEYLRGADRRWSPVDNEFRARLENSLPLYGSRWIPIILNGFRREWWEARQCGSNGLSHGAWRTFKARQLVKARALAERVAVAFNDPDSLL